MALRCVTNETYGLAIDGDESWIFMTCSGPETVEASPSSAPNPRFDAMLGEEAFPEGPEVPVRHVGEWPVDAAIRAVAEYFRDFDPAQQSGLLLQICPNGRHAMRFSDGSTIEIPVAEVPFLVRGVWVLGASQTAACHARASLDWAWPDSAMITIGGDDE